MPKSKSDKILRIPCIKGFSGSREILLGCARASDLCRVSAADILNEDTGAGYQRRFNVRHSLDFRNYIQEPGATTTPLVFNLRPKDSSLWSTVSKANGQTELQLQGGVGPVLWQVDCQHRLGHLADLAVTLPFICFVGLSEHEEMETFNTINAKAKGLSASLLDYHDAHLVDNAVHERPELFIALQLAEQPSSPWYKQLDLGGQSTSGMHRRASLRTMQKAVKRFLTRTRILEDHDAATAGKVIEDFWNAIAIALPEQWHNPRKHMLTKGIGVYSLMEIAAGIYSDNREHKRVDRTIFASALSDFALSFDWSSHGPLKGLGGQSGVACAVDLIREHQRHARIRVVANG